MTMVRTTIELESAEAVRAHVRAGRPLCGVVVQGVDLRADEALLAAHGWAGVTLLGCRLSAAAQQQAVAAGALLFPPFDDLPFEPYRAQLYGVEELYDVFEPDSPESYQGCLDARVYQHWRDNGGTHAENILETLARRLHDHAITDALEEFLQRNGQASQVVAIMGGHGMARGADSYVKVARIARELTRRGFLLASGGGPGAMEATHVGAWFVDRSDDALAEAMSILATAPRYDDPLWLTAAFQVRERFPLSSEAQQRHPSLGIPTWLYGHEPPNAFATHIAKYFANSVREEGLLAIAKHGVVYSPGGAGTIQEIFQDACQNHYLTVDVASPMVFLGVDYWQHEKPVFPLLQKLAIGHQYGRWLAITDDVDEVVTRIVAYRDQVA